MTAFWFAAIFLIQSQLPDQVQPGAVTGRLLSVNGTPAAGIRIAAVPVVEGEEKAGATALLGISQTDADGRYRLEGIPPGRYYIFAGLIDLPSYYPNATALDRAKAIVVDAGSTVSGIDFSMARPAGLTVSGRLAIPSTMRLDENATLTVSLTPQTRGAAAGFLQSKVGPDGSFEFLRVSPGEYRLSSNLGGSTPLNLKVVDVDLTDTVIPVADCNAGVLVSGRLVGTFPPLPRSISLAGSGAGCGATTQVEADGSFTFSKVPEGAYQLQLTPAPLGWSATRLTVEKSDVTGMEIQLPAMLQVKGRAFVEDGSPFPKASRGGLMPIRAIRANGGESGTSVQDDGTFELLLPKGSYRLSVPGIPANYYVKSMSSGFADLETSSLVVGDTPPAEIHLTLGLVRRPQSGVRLSGHLSLAAAGALLNAESVRLVSTASRNAGVRESAVAPDGSFEFSDVPTGIYNLETFPDNPSALYGIVVGNSDVTGIEFSLPVLVKVNGGIEWADSQGVAVPPARPSVSVQFTRKEGNRMLAWGALAHSGAFQFYLPEGDYRFSVSDVPSEFNLGSVTSGDANVLESGLRVRSDAEAPSLRVTLREKE
jgi:hypothetical protein